MDTNILIFGDSITYGAWDYDKAGWVNRLRMKLDKNDNYYNVFNLGIPGNTSDNILKRLEFELTCRYDIHAKTIAIFSIGINDSQIIGNTNNINIKKFRDNINLINITKKYTKNILFIGLTNVDEKKVSPLPWNNNISYYNKEIILYDNVIQNICKEHNIDYLKLFNTLNNDELEDGLHPNSKGHEKIYKKVIDYYNEVN